MATKIEIATIQLMEYWRRQRISSSPNALEVILHFEFSKGIQLPWDFRYLYMQTNGMTDMFPNDMDEEGFLFYPLQVVTTMEEQFEINRLNYEQPCLIFAEYMHESWFYGVRFSRRSDEYEIGIIPMEDRFTVITKSLAEFIQLYITDASILYDY